VAVFLVFSRIGYFDGIELSDLIQTNKEKSGMVSESEDKVNPDTGLDTFKKGINIISEKKSDDILDGTIEVVFKGRVLENIYVDDGFNKVDFVPDDNSQQVTFVLNDATMESFPLTLVDKEGKTTSKSTKISTMKSYLTDNSEAQVKCNILDPNVFVDNCNHDKCDLWADDVVRFRQTWDNYIETSAWPSELGFCVSIEIEIK